MRDDETISKLLFPMNTAYLTRQTGSHYLSREGTRKQKTKLITVVTVFFFTYCAFEVPSNLLLKKLRPSIWLPTIMVAWGTVMTLMGIVQGYHGLLIARIFLGVTEAGLYPGVAYYITMWYVREEGQFRQAMFFSAASVAGAFSGLLAFAIAVSSLYSFNKP